LKNALSSKQFKKVYFDSKPIAFGRLLFRTKRDLNPKIGIIVSKKYGGAVKRNLFKRRCRTAFYMLKASSLTHSIIVMPKKKIYHGKKFFNLLST
tara:strand:- start:414 stop:698 length:285 start_codon:yes stop_codon:yes gene_type:complete